MYGVKDAADWNRLTEPQQKPYNDLAKQVNQTRAADHSKNVQLIYKWRGKIERAAANGNAQLSDDSSDEEDVFGFFL